MCEFHQIGSKYLKTLYENLKEESDAHLDAFFRMVLIKPSSINQSCISHVLNLAVLTNVLLLLMAIVRLMYMRFISNFHIS